MRRRKDVGRKERGVDGGKEGKGREGHRSCQDGGRVGDGGGGHYTMEPLPASAVS